MPYYVCKGAKLKCSFGSQESDLGVMHPVKPVYLQGQFMANIQDYKPMMNIMPFGQCKSLANPAVAAATAANYGVLREMPCIPNVVAPWMLGNLNYLVKGQPALMDNSMCNCVWGGLIQITNDGQADSAGKVETGGKRITKEENKCTLCGKGKSEHKAVPVTRGCSRGNSAVLGRSMQDPNKHPWSKLKGGDTIAAHHLIPSNLVDDADKKNIWAELCRIYGYDINCKENGVYLPATLPFACHLAVPLHFGSHGSGFTDEFNENEKKTIKYEERINLDLDRISKNYTIEDNACPEETEGGLIGEMNDLSKMIFDKLKDFTWTITYDAIHYKNESLIGCGNKSTIAEKQEKIDEARKDMGNKTEVNGFRLYKKNIQNIREVRDDMLRNCIEPCSCGRAHSTKYSKIAPKQTIKYGGTY